MNPTGADQPTGVPPAPQPAAAPSNPAAAAAPAPAAPKPAPAVPKPAAPPPPPPPPVPVPESLAKLPIPFQGVDYAWRGYHAEARVEPGDVVRCAQVLDHEGFSLDTITGVDWMAENQMEVVYDYFHPSRCMRVAVRARIPRENPEIDTILKVFPGANWHERETHDFFGIRFHGHPYLVPFLLPEDATYHPLKKDFASDPK